MDAAGVDEARLRAFLADSLALWRVAGEVQAATAPDVAEIRAQDGTLVWIARPAGTDTPFRWLVRWRPAGELPGSSREQRPRPCTSVVGLLNALRLALGVERGGGARVVPSSSYGNLPEAANARNSPLPPGEG